MPAVKDTTTVRITCEAHEKLRAMADEDEVSLTEALDRLIEAQRRKRFLEALNRDYAALRADKEAWREFQEEVALWENMLMDGLENEPPYYEESEEEAHAH